MATFIQLLEKTMRRSYRTYEVPQMMINVKNLIKNNKDINYLYYYTNRELPYTVLDHIIDEYIEVVNNYRECDFDNIIINTIELLLKYNAKNIVKIYLDKYFCDRDDNLLVKLLVRYDATDNFNITIDYSDLLKQRNYDITHYMNFKEIQLNKIILKFIKN